MWRLKLRQGCRIFQQQRTPEILASLLEEAGVPRDRYRFKLSRKAYPPREHRVQYRESDWAFLCRLMEEEGLFYYFEHTAEEHTLIVADAPYAHEPLPEGDTLLLRPPTGALATGEHASSFTFAQEMQAGRVTLRNYSFKTPAVLLESEARAGGASEDLEVYDFPGESEDPRATDEMAKLLLEERQASARVGTAESNVMRACPGYVVALQGHPHDDLNRRYLLTAVDHQGAQALFEAVSPESRYTNRLRCIGAEIPFRAPRQTPRPAIHGVQTAVVVGPEGEEIHTDKHGRVRVRFHWDRVKWRDGHDSCWIRVSQSWAGQG
ncbi:VgrG protein [Chondromyces apiculatus DSM 436]|uniref:VgrG protein n=1 Tax=Chondromyces apiculatus DSM 436 TaxID=1192034 RepID=A0A017T830_9BACT|nr:VgrG protein [Chondromyces apiculatus DSM 436]